MRPEARPLAPQHRRIAALLVLAVLLVPAAALAEEDDDPFDRRGFYFGAAGVYTHNFFDDQIDDTAASLVGPNADVDIDDSFGVNVRVGYRLISFFAVELQYEWVDNFETEITSSALAGTKATIDITGHSLTANAKLIAPFWRIQPYLLAGAGYAVYDADTNSIASIVGISGGDERGFAGRAGGGIDWYFTRNLVVSTEVTALVTTQDFNEPDTGEIDNLYYLSMGLGIQWRF